MSDKPIFVMGCRRSGTELTRNILNLHPRIGLLINETHFFDRIMPRLKNVDIATRKGRVVEILLAMDRWRAAESQGSRILQRHLLEEKVYSQLTDFTPREIFETLLKASAHFEGKTRWGEKTPTHIFYVDRIKDWFPKAKIIQIIRHPCAVASSHLRQGRSMADPKSSWYYISLPFILQWWLRTSRLAVRYQQTYADDFHLLKFEDLITNPCQSVQDLCMFVGEDFDGAMLTPPLLNSSFEDYKPDFGFHIDTLVRWKMALPRWTQLIILTACWPYMKRFAYDERTRLTH